MTRTRTATRPDLGDRQILNVVLASLDDDQAIDPSTIDLHGKSLIADHMVVASGRSNRHVSAIATHLAEKLKAEGVQVRTEGLAKGDWVLLDCGDVIVHLFRPEVRDYYNLEKMWSAALPDDSVPATGP
ncbi:MAG: ribosome silencing factor [Alphaproteobacteria bacterium]